MTTWSPEEDKLLLALRQQGLSYSQITVELAVAGFEARTRNAVIGRGNRIGLVEAKKPRQYRPRVPKAPRERPAPRPSSIMVARPKPVPPPVPAKAEPLHGAGMSILDPHLTMDHCRYPLWPHNAPPFGERIICAATVRTGRPYCPYHCSIAYQPLAERTRRAA